MSIPGGIRILEQGQWVSFKDGPHIPDCLTKPLMVADYTNISDFGVTCLFIDLIGNVYSYWPKECVIISGNFSYNFNARRYEVFKHDQKSVSAIYGPKLNELVDTALKAACDHSWVLNKYRATLRSKFIASSQNQV